jgi:hypothetical protein
VYQQMAARFFEMPKVCEHGPGCADEHCEEMQARAATTEHMAAALASSIEDMLYQHTRALNSAAYTRQRALTIVQQRLGAEWKRREDEALAEKHFGLIPGWNCD